MPTLKNKLAALAAAFLMAACGGGSSPQIKRIVSFGDSLSDVGTYRVGTVAAVGGGQFTVNGPAPTNWTERLAAMRGLPAPCAAQTGLLTNMPGFTGAAVTDVAGCVNYAQGSARVSHAIGPNSAALQQAPFNQVTLGLMAVPVATQVQMHLARHGGVFAGDELVTVLAGGNDLFMHFAAIASAAGGGDAAVGAAIAAGWSPAAQATVAGGGAAATDAAIQAALSGMAQAGAELATLIKSQVLGKGARLVVVSNLFDVSLTPFGLSLDPSTRALINNMVVVFNQQLHAGLSGSPLLLVDAYAYQQAQAAQPAASGLTNVTTPACSTTAPANPLQGASITCTSASLIEGDTSGFLYADGVHPTPLGHTLFAQFVHQSMVAVGWD